MATPGQRGGHLLNLKKGYQIKMKKNFFFINSSFDKSKIKNLVSWFFTNCGEAATLKLVEELKDLGFYYATHAGISLNLEDLKTPTTKSELISRTERETEHVEKQYAQGVVTAVERFQLLIDTWHKTSEAIKRDVVQNFRSTDPLNPLYMMAFSGARGNISQVRQLVGMRGLMADPQGRIIDFPIQSNFREGLTLTEYVISCYGARKGLVDTALRTATSGYLTRRLVDVSQQVVVSEFNCRTSQGIFLGDLRDKSKVLLPLSKRLIGRVLGESLLPVAEKDQQISAELANHLVRHTKKTGRDQILVRSPLTCASTNKSSVCQFCYGWSMAYASLVPIGESVGILAGQSIGEPGTQLTMRTFHTGGVFSGDVMDVVRAPFAGTLLFVQPLQGLLVRTSHGQIAFLTKVPGRLVLQATTKTKPPLLYPSRVSSAPSKNPGSREKSAVQADIKTSFPVSAVSNGDHSNPSSEAFLGTANFSIPAGSLLFVRHGEIVSSNQVIAETSSLQTEEKEQLSAKHMLYSEFEGEAFFEKVLVKVSKGRGQSRTNRTKIAYNLASIWVLFGKKIQSVASVAILPKTGDLIDKETVLHETFFNLPSAPFTDVQKDNCNSIEVKESLKGESVSNAQRSPSSFFSDTAKGVDSRFLWPCSFLLSQEDREHQPTKPCSALPFQGIMDVSLKKNGSFVRSQANSDLNLFYAVSNPLYKRESRRGKEGWPQHLT